MGHGIKLYARHYMEQSPADTRHKTDDSDSWDEHIDIIPGKTPMDRMGKLGGTTDWVSL